VTAFGRLFVPAEPREAVSGRAWTEAMLDAERALAGAGSTEAFVDRALVRHRLEVGR
jgi:hypothetical protein